MILLWGLPGDGPLDAVRAALRALGASYILLDQADAPSTRAKLLVDESVSATIAFPSGAFDLADITAVYLRTYDVRRLPAVVEAGEDSEAWRAATTLDDILLSWLEVTPALVVNLPSAMASNNSKPYQSTVIRSFGFAVPDTLVTTDPEEAERFWRRHGDVIYKSVSGVRSIVSRLREEHRERLPDLAWCPTQFQQWIPGTDYRAHVVGSQVFASQVVSDADDYRYAGRQGGETNIRAAVLPQNCAAKCRALAAGLGLSVAGVDLRRTPDDEWYCFEVNPSPGFTYYQHATGQPIDLAIARLLAMQT